jgi:hypothetical protein
MTTATLLRAGSPGGPGCADEHLVADADEASPWPQVADVLIVHGTLTRPAEHPECRGWLVAAFAGPDEEYLLEVSTGRLARLVPLVAHRAGDLWTYASFVHAWTVAGRPLDALHGARLTAGPHGVRVIVVERSTAWPEAA